MKFPPPWHPTFHYSVYKILPQNSIRSHLNSVRIFMFCFSICLRYSLMLFSHLHQGLSNGPVSLGVSSKTVCAFHTTRPVFLNFFVKLSFHRLLGLTGGPFLIYFFTRILSCFSIPATCQARPDRLYVLSRSGRRG
jgi:hypothetical protein